jgi:hypothetical protein
MSLRAKKIASGKPALVEAPSDGIGQEQLHYILIFKQPQKFIAPIFIERF